MGRRESLKPWAILVFFGVLGWVIARFCDANLRGRAPGETATNVIEGIRQARASGSARASRAEKVLDEMTAVKTALRRAIPGDLVVCCVDDAVAVYREAMSAAGTSRGGTAFADPGELEAPEG